ncbi:MAG: ATP-binding cassette domain-containing protein [Lachnospiraceae bacterium]|nr:ATP-binding cassette domain-containing protein [Lachnospiraceae bacterium]
MLSVRNLSLGVRENEEDIEIIKNITLDFPDDRFIAITGPNGGGKSTLARLIAGIRTPSAGQILLDGQDITALSVTERAKLGISFAFQQPVRFKGLQVKDLIRIAAGKDLSIVDACEYLSAVGLCARDYIDREINASLSGGELKRIEIATVLARGTRISVFDEPEAGIDLWSFQNLIQVFKKMRETVKGTIIIISHQERILEIADSIVVISGGEVTDEGPRDAILPKLLGTDAALQACDRVLS